MSKIAWALVIGVVVLIVLGFAASLLVPYRGGGYGWGMMGPWMMGGFGFPFFGGLMMLIFWVLIIVGVVWLIQALARGGQSPFSPPSYESPLDILRARYARGEITKDQFDQMRRDLGV